MDGTACARCGEELTHPIMLRKEPDGADAVQAHPYGTTCAKIVLGIPRERWSRSKVYYAVLFRFKGGEWKDSRGALDRVGDLDGWIQRSFAPTLVKRSALRHYEFSLEALVEGMGR